MIVFTFWVLLNPLNADLNPICHLLELLGAHHILHVGKITVKLPSRFYCNKLLQFIFAPVQNSDTVRRTETGVGVTSIYQPTNPHIISYKTLSKHFKHSDMFRSCQIIVRDLCALLELYYSIHNSQLGGSIILKIIVTKLCTGM